MACVGERHYPRSESYKSPQLQTNVASSQSTKRRNSQSPMNESPLTYSLHDSRGITSAASQPAYQEPRSPQRPRFGSRPVSLQRGSSYTGPYSPVRSNTEDEDTVAKALLWVPKVPYTQSGPRRRLERPVAIPQMDAEALRRYMPFTRAYSPALQAHDVCVEEFVGFLDNLAVVQAPLPPFQAVGIVGMGISFVPHHWSQLIGNGEPGPANAGSAVTPRTRTQKYLREANQRYFAPRGLKVRIMRDADLAQLVEFPDILPSLSQLDSSIGAATLRDRRLRAMEEHISPLTFDVPPLPHQNNLLDRISAKKVDAQIAKTYKKACKDHREHLAKLEVQPSRRSSTASESSVSSSSEFEDGSDSEVYTTSKLDKIKSLELEIRKINLDAESEMLKAESRDSSKAIKIEEHRLQQVAKVETEMKKLRRQQVEQSTVARDYLAEKQAAKTAERLAKSNKEADKQLRNLAWIVIENLNSDELNT